MNGCQPLLRGHAKPDACMKDAEHMGAHPDHPCGPSDAVDPEQANKTVGVVALFEIFLESKHRLMTAGSDNQSSPVTSPCNQPM